MRLNQFKRGLNDSNTGNSFKKSC